MPAGHSPPRSQPRGRPRRLPRRATPPHPRRRGGVVCCLRRPRPGGGGPAAGMRHQRQPDRAGRRGGRGSGRRPRERSGALRRWAGPFLRVRLRRGRAAGANAARVRLPAGGCPSRRRVGRAAADCAGAVNVRGVPVCGAGRRGDGYHRRVPLDRRGDESAETLQMCALVCARASSVSADALHCLLAIERACVRAGGRAGGRVRE